MRIFLIIMGVLLCVSNLKAQTIAYDNIEVDGSRQIVTSLREYSIKGKRYYVGIRYVEKNDSAKWYLMFSPFTEFPRESDILLKFDDGSNIHLTMDGVLIKKFEEPGSAYTFGYYTTFTMPHEVEVYTSLFSLTDSMFNAIEEKNIVKIRMHDGLRNKDENIIWNSFGKYIRRGRMKILRARGVKQNLYDDF